MTDTNALLAKARELAEAILSNKGYGTTTSRTELAEAFTELDDALSRDEYLPADWDRPAPLRWIRDRADGQWKPDYDTVRAAQRDLARANYKRCPICGISEHPYRIRQHVLADAVQIREELGR